MWLGLQSKHRRDVIPSVAGSSAGTPTLRGLVRVVGGDADATRFGASPVLSAGTPTLRGLVRVVGGDADAPRVGACRRRVRRGGGGGGVASAVGG
ncbi:MAG: hypothetical protein P3X24_004695, partial [bacterium]|nr:hypothetical protein [bacterium]